MDMTDGRDRIIRATLPNVPFDGWTEAALRAGAEEAGLGPETAARLFPRGVIQGIEHSITLADRDMLAGFDAKDTSAMGTTAKVRAAVLIRLEQNVAHREAIRRAATLLALPHNAPIALRTLYRTVDAIWLAAGDTSTDYNFYTKRAILAGVYSATLAFWLNDKSEDNAATAAFLDRRLADSMRFGKATARLKSVADRLPDPFKILGRMRYPGANRF